MLAHHYLNGARVRARVGPGSGRPRRARAAGSQGRRRSRGRAGGARNRGPGSTRRRSSSGPKRTADRAELMLSALEARWSVEGGDLSEGAEEARDRLLTAGRTDLAAEAELLLTNIFWYQGDHERCWNHLGAARELAENLPASRTKARVLAEVSRFHMLAGEPDPAIEIGVEALEMAEALGLDVLQASRPKQHRRRRAQAWATGPGIDDLERAIEIAERSKERPRARARADQSRRDHGPCGRARSRVRARDRGRRGGTCGRRSDRHSLERREPDQVPLLARGSGTRRSAWPRRSSSKQSRGSPSTSQRRPTITAG